MHRQDCLRRGGMREAREALGLEVPGEAQGERGSRKPAPVTGAWRRLQRMVLFGGSYKEHPRPSSASTSPPGQRKARSHSLPPVRNKIRGASSYEDGDSASGRPWVILEAANEPGKDALSLDSPGWTLTSPGWSVGSRPGLWEDGDCTVYTGPTLTNSTVEATKQALSAHPERRESALLPPWSDSRWGKHLGTARGLPTSVVSFSEPLPLGARQQESHFTQGTMEGEATGLAAPTLHLVNGTARIVSANPAALQALGFESEAAAAQRSVLDIADGLTEHEWRAAVSKILYGECTSSRIM